MYSTLQPHCNTLLYQVVICLYYTPTGMAPTAYTSYVLDPHYN